MNPKEFAEMIDRMAAQSGNTAQEVIEAYNTLKPVSQYQEAMALYREGKGPEQAAQPVKRSFTAFLRGE